MRFLLLFFTLLSLLFASIDINNASEKELQELYGIGVKKAQAIIEYREKNGCFSSIDALLKVKGIGAKTLEKNRENLIAGKCKK